MRRELTWQSLVSAFIVAVLVSASYPYVVLKLGMGPNISVVSAFLGAIFLLVLSPRTQGQNRWMNNVVQTAGTSAASTAFMCVIAAAVDLADKNGTVKDKLNGIHHIDPWPMFFWLTCAGSIGVLFTVLFRRHFLDDPKMVFADGVAAAETIVVLDTRGRESADKLGMLSMCALASAAVDWFREGREGVESLPDWFPAPLFKSYKAGIEWNLLSLGSGLLVGLNVSLSMLAATLVVVTAGPHLIGTGIGREIVLGNVPDVTVPRMALFTRLGLLGGRTQFDLLGLTAINSMDEPLEEGGILVNARAECARLIETPWNDLSFHNRIFVGMYGQGGRQPAYMKHDYFSVVLLWFMWPATGLMITSAITAVLLKWRSVVESLGQLRMRGKHEAREDVSLKTVVVGSIFFTIALALIQHQNFGMSYLQTAVAVLCSLPLILVGIRVLGETNNGPISVMMNGLQAVFALFWSGNVGHNLIAAGMAGTCNTQGEGTIQDYKTGKLIGSTPRVLTWVQLTTVPIGAAAVAIMYPLLLDRYELGVDLTTPTGVKIANMAVLLSQGIDAFPRGALFWTVVASIAGIGITLARHFLQIEWLPSPAGFGFGLILPGTLNVVMAIGGIAGWFWERTAKQSYERFAVTVASGLIAGEALLGGLVLPVLSWFRVH